MLTLWVFPRNNLACLTHETYAISLHHLLRNCFLIRRNGWNPFSRRALVRGPELNSAPVWPWQLAETFLSHMCVSSGDLARINNEREKENWCLIKLDSAACHTLWALRRKYSRKDKHAGRFDVFLSFISLSSCYLGMWSSTIASGEWRDDDTSRSGKWATHGWRKNT